MSALGQKQTLALQKGMSALPSKADIARVRFTNQKPLAAGESDQGPYIEWFPIVLDH